jgi:hypothetical protein
VLCTAWFVLKHLSPAHAELVLLCNAMDGELAPGELHFGDVRTFYEFLWTFSGMHQTPLRPNWRGCLLTGDSMIPRQPHRAQ